MFKVPNMLRLATTLGAGFALAACSSIGNQSWFSFSNNPQLPEGLQYITIKTPNYSLERALQKSLSQNGLIVLSEDAKLPALYRAAYQVKLSQNLLKSSQKLNGVDTRCLDLYARRGTLITKEQAEGKEEVANLKVENPATVYQCLVQFVPQLNLSSYDTLTKAISLYADGSTAQQVVYIRVQSKLAIPFAGNIELSDIISNIQLTNSATPLASLRRNEALDPIYKLEAADRIAEKVVFILENNYQLIYRAGDLSLSNGSIYQQDLDRAEAEARKASEALLKQEREYQARKKNP